MTTQLSTAETPLSVQLAVAWGTASPIAMPHSRRGKSPRVPVPPIPSNQQLAHPSSKAAGSKNPAPPPLRLQHHFQKKPYPSSLHSVKMESATAQVLSGEDAVLAATFAADMLAGDQTAASEGQDGGLNYWDNEVSFDLEQLFASAPLPHPCLAILAAHRTAVAGPSRPKGKSPLSIVGAALPVISEPDEVKDIFMCESGTASRPARVPVVSFNSRSPPPPASRRARLPHLGSGGSRPTGTPSSSSSIEVESDDISSADSPQTGQLNQFLAQLNPAFAELLRMYPLHYDMFAPYADMRITAHYASAFLYPAASEPSRVIWEAMREYLPHIHFSLNPARRGAMFVRFSTPEDRDAAVDFPGTMMAEGHILVLEKPEDNETCFHQPLDKLTELEVLDWPPEHRIPGRIRNLFIGVAFVIEIDDECVYGDDMSFLCLVVQQYPGQPVLPAMFVWLRNGDIAVAKIKIIRTWDASQNFDDNGTYTHHFPVLVVPNPGRHFSQAPLPPPPINPGQPRIRIRMREGGHRTISNMTLLFRLQLLLLSLKITCMFGVQFISQSWWMIQ